MLDIEKLLEGENIESDFYLNDSLNDDLESKLKKNSWRCSKSDHNDS